MTSFPKLQKGLRKRWNNKNLFMYPGFVRIEDEQQTLMNYSIWQLSKTRLFDLAEFVVSENYRHHKKQEIDNEGYMDEIFQVYNEELRFFKHSKIFAPKIRKIELLE